MAKFEISERWYVEAENLAEAQQKYDEGMAIIGGIYDIEEVEGVRYILTLEAYVNANSPEEAESKFNEGGYKAYVVQVDEAFDKVRY